MKKLVTIFILCVAAVVNAAAAFTLTATDVDIQDLTIDKDNFFVTVSAETSSGEYEVGFDIWPATHSAIGSFSAAEGTITYSSCWVHKTKANGSAVDMWYYSDEDAEISLSIVKKDDKNCTLSGSIQATRQGTTYTYNIAEFDFAYSEGSDDPDPDPKPEDPYRLEPTEVTTLDFTVDVVAFREHEDFVEIHIFENEAENPSWVELRLLSDEYAWPAGTYTIDDSGAAGTLTASKGNIDATNEDPCYVAIMTGDFGTGYTPYYLVSGSLTVSYNAKGDTIIVKGTAQTHNGSTVTFNVTSKNELYTEEEPGGGDKPDPDDPYRYEPKDAVTIDFVADSIAFREKENLVEIKIRQIANETYHWIELHLLTDTLDMPAGTYTINDSGAKGTLTASLGYLGGTDGDDPCYVAIRGPKEEWGQYTPYYLVSGSLTVSFNEKGDTIFIKGTTTSHNGSTIKVDARGFNELYVPAVEPKQPKDVTLLIDTVAITYMSNLSDSANNIFVYTFNFSKSLDFPSVITDVIMNKPMELVAGTYTLADQTLDGLILSQNQTDFELNIFGGGAYVFESASLTLVPDKGIWRYTMEMHDDIGSTYRFSFVQTPHIVHYPTPAEDVKDEPYKDEQKEKATITLTCDSIVWKDATVKKDGVLDILLTQRQADINGLKAYLHLGMYTDVSFPATGTYSVSDSEENGTFSASLGRYGDVLIPCYLLLLDNEGWAHAIWYIVSGNILLTYDEANQPLLSGECTTYFGSTIKFSYTATQGIQNTDRFTDRVQTHKILRNGQVLIIRGDKAYDILGNEL